MLKNPYYLILILPVILLSCSRNPTAISVKPIPKVRYIIPDYQYIAFQYFFVDEYYRDHFEKGFSDDLLTYSIPSDKKIINLEVFISTYISDMYAVKGIASVDPSQYDSITADEFENFNEIKGEMEKGYFKLLIEGKDYFIDTEFRGFFYLKKPVRNFESLAVAYQTETGKVGTFLSDVVNRPQNQILNLKLIKSKNMTPSDTKVWDLMLKNVYDLKDTTLTLNSMNIFIEYNQHGQFVSVQPNKPNKRFTFLLGLDIRNNTTGELTDNGDGKVDANFLLLNLSKGILMFPSLQPFDPSPDSRFQLNPLNRSPIYNISPSDSIALRNNSKFRIVVEKYD